MERRTLLIDFDDTLVDFKVAEHYALEAVLNHYGLPMDHIDIWKFSRINQAHWEAFQKGEITKDVVLQRRFEQFFEQRHRQIDGKEADALFRKTLAEGPLQYFPGTEEGLTQLAEHFDLYIVTNGATETQKHRLSRMPFAHLFKDVFISEALGQQKPNKAFFDAVFERIGVTDTSDILIVGDALSSDILGGKNAGIATCWFNPNKVVNDTDIQPDFEVTSFVALYAHLTS